MQIGRSVQPGAIQFAPGAGMVMSAAKIALFGRLAVTGPRGVAVGHNAPAIRPHRYRSKSAPCPREVMAIRASARQGLDCLGRKDVDMFMACYRYS